MKELNKTLDCSYNMDIESAYIITLQGNDLSEKLAARCINSCKSVDMPCQIYPAFDGTGKTIKVPQHLEECCYLKWIKVVDSQLSLSEIACALSHFSLWTKCIELDQPIVILEHDAIMLQKFSSHPMYGTIVYLGCYEQYAQGWSTLMTPPHGTFGKNYHFICRAHSYAIDPAIAKNLVAHIIKYGIHESLDVMLRPDIFPIIQVGLYAYDHPTEVTTITYRKKGPDGKER